MACKLSLLHACNLSCMMLKRTLLAPASWCSRQWCCTVVAWLQEPLLDIMLLLSACAAASIPRNGRSSCSSKTSLRYMSASCCTAFLTYYLHVCCFGHEDVNQCHVAHNAHGSLIAYAEAHSHHDKLSSCLCGGCSNSSCNDLLSP